MSLLIIAKFAGMLMYFLYGVIESIGHLSEDEKKKHLRKERTTSTSSTLSTVSANSNHNSTVNQSGAQSEVRPDVNSTQNNANTSKCDNNVEIESIPNEETIEKTRL